MPSCTKTCSTRLSVCTNHSSWINATSKTYWEVGDVMAFVHVMTKCQQQHPRARIRMLLRIWHLPLLVLQIHDFHGFHPERIVFVVQFM